MASEAWSPAREGECLTCQAGPYAEHAMPRVETSTGAPPAAICRHCAAGGCTPSPPAAEAEFTEYDLVDLLACCCHNEREKAERIEIEFAALRARAREAEERAEEEHRFHLMFADLYARACSDAARAECGPGGKMDLERERDEAREQRDALSCENGGLRAQRDEITALAAAANARAEEVTLDLQVSERSLALAEQDRATLKVQLARATDTLGTERAAQLRAEAEVKRLNDEIDKRATEAVVNGKALDDERREHAATKKARESINSQWADGHRENAALRERCRRLEEVADRMGSRLEERDDDMWQVCLRDLLAAAKDAPDAARGEVSVSPVPEPASVALRRLIKASASEEVCETIDAALPALADLVEAVEFIEGSGHHWQPIHSEGSDATCPACIAGRALANLRAKLGVGNG